MNVKIENKPYALIIDDELDICYLLKGILRHRHIDAEYVTSLSAAKEKLKDTHPPVIFLDNYLGDGFGINYIKTIKLEHPESKVVMITAHDAASDRERAYNAGVDYFISKPFTREIIFKTMDNIGLTNH